MARIPYPEPGQLSPQTSQAVAALPPLNIFRMLSHADSAFAPFLGFAGSLLTQLELDPALRELVILITAKKTEAEYEWIQHVEIAKAVGVTEDQIAAVEAEDFSSNSLSPEAEALLGFAAQVLEQPRADDEAFAAVSAKFPPRQIVETLLVIGSYRMLGGVMTNLDLELDAGVDAASLREAEAKLDA